MLLISLLACGSPADDTGTPKDSGEETGESGETGETAAPTGDMVLTDANNYAYSGLLDAPSVTTAELTDIHFDWSRLTLDLQCHEVDPVKDIDNIALLAFPYLSEEEVEAGLSAGDLQQVDLGGYVSLEVGDRTDANLTELTFFGTDVDIEKLYAEGSATWLLLLTTGDTVGVGARTLLFLEPRADEDNTEAAFEDDCDILDFTADLTSLTPVRVGPAPWSVAWGGLTTDGQGGSIELGNIDQLTLGVYPGQTPEDLAAAFLDLDRIAAGLWTWDVGGSTSLDLATPTADGTTFPGFDQDGTWILALRCTLCANPAPLFLTVIEP